MADVIKILAYFQIAEHHSQQSPEPAEGHQGPGGYVSRAGGAGRKPDYRETASHVGEAIVPITQTTGQLRQRLP